MERKTERGKTEEKKKERNLKEFETLENAGWKVDDLFSSRKQG